MAVKRNKKTKGNVKENNSRKKGLFNRKLVIVAAASSVVVSAVLFVTTYKDCRVKDAEARLIEEQIKS